MDERRALFVGEARQCGLVIGECPCGEFVFFAVPDLRRGGNIPIPFLLRVKRDQNTYHNAKNCPGDSRYKGKGILFGLPTGS